MFLYKCISFEKDYFGYIANEQKIRFATIAELQGGNDAEEFTYSFNTNSSFLKYYTSEGDLQKLYKDELEETVVLSACCSPNQDIWERYCATGGVRYKFEFDATQTQDITHRKVEYTQDKEHNICKYLIKNEKNNKFKRLLRYEGGLTRDDYKVGLDWNNHPRTIDLITNHIINELTVKKHPRYADEDEYRFVHLLEDINPNHRLRARLIDQKIEFSQMGLRLVEIATDDVSKAKNKIHVAQNLIVPINFS